MRLCEAVAGINQPIDLRAVSRPLLNLVEVAIVRILRIVGFFREDVALFMDPLGIRDATNTSRLLLRREYGREDQQIVSPPREVGVCVRLAPSTLPKNAPRFAATRR